MNNFLDDRDQVLEDHDESEAYKEEREVERYEAYRDEVNEAMY